MPGCKGPCRRNRSTSLALRPGRSARPDRCRDLDRSGSARQQRRLATSAVLPHCLLPQERQGRQRRHDVRPRRCVAASEGTPRSCKRSRSWAEGAGSVEIRGRFRCDARRQPTFSGRCRPEDAGAPSPWPCLPSRAFEANRLLKSCHGQAKDVSKSPCRDPHVHASPPSLASCGSSRRHACRTELFDSRTTAPLRRGIKGVPSAMPAGKRPHLVHRMRRVGEIAESVFHCSVTVSRSA